MGEILRSELRDLDLPTAAEITNVKHLSSYNWIANKWPTIAVPGSPALWAPPKGSKRVDKDSGLVYINQNAARRPDSPLEPLFLALYATQPSFDISSTDIVTDRNNLRKLLSFVLPGALGDALKPFTMEIEMHKNTALFCRVEKSNQESIPYGEFRGFGHEFEKAYTREQIKESTGHFRIVSYRFGDMNIIVRHETDGYLGEGTKSGAIGDETGQADQLSSALGSLSLTSKPAPTDPHGLQSKVVVRREGQPVPLDCTLEVKTRAQHRILNIQEVAPQIWISQTPKLVRAYHRGGIFQEPQVEDVTAQVERWQRENQEQLRKLAALIRKILALVKLCDGRATVSYISGSDKLVISPLHGKKMLPESLYLKWDPKPLETPNAPPHQEPLPEREEPKEPKEPQERV